MTVIARLLEQRSSGEVRLRVEREGVSVMREAGASKCRLPRGSREAILINTSGGLAGGDVIDICVEAGEGAALTVTSQAAERVYRSVGPDADVRVQLTVERDASLFWLPQETIFFEGAALSRSLDVDLGQGSTFLAVEPLIFGRREMGERVQSLSFTDRWTVRRAGRLEHAEAIRLEPTWQDSAAAFSDNVAAATVLLISADAEALLDRVRRLLGPQDGASAWNGKLVARFLAKDSYALRKSLIPVLSVCVGQRGLPKCWTF